jgi:hypothetical protein
MARIMYLCQPELQIAVTTAMRPKDKRVFADIGGAPI